MSKEEELVGSFAPEEEQTPKKPKSPPPTDASAPLFKLMGEIRDAINKQTEVVKENTEAINSLLTTLVGQTSGVPVPALVYKPSEEEGKKVEVGHTMEEQAGVQAIKPVMPPNAVTQPFSPPLPTPSETHVGESHIEQVKMLFPQDLESLLSFTDEGDYIKVKPRQWLGSDNFAKVAAVVRGVGGEYKSAGKESHFRIPKK